MTAIYMDDSNTVTQLILDGIDVNEKPTGHATFTRSAMAVAIQTQQEKYVRMLLETKRSNGLDEHLKLASMNQNARIVRLLLEAGADPNYHNGHISVPLSAACIGGNLEVLSTLIEFGANINEPLMAKGMTILMFFADKGLADHVRLLLKLGANKELRDKKQKTAYDYIRPSETENELRELLTPEK